MPYKHFADNKWIAELERLQKEIYQLRAEDTYLREQIASMDARAHRDSNEAAEAIFDEGAKRIMAEKKNTKLLATINDYLSGNICKKSFRENIEKLTAKGVTNDTI